MGQSVGPGHLAQARARRDRRLIEAPRHRLCRSLQLHRYDPNTPLDETLDALDTVVKSGKARYVGVSNWPSIRSPVRVGRSELRNVVRIDSAQPRYNLLFRASSATCFRTARKRASR